MSEPAPMVQQPGTAGGDAATRGVRRPSLRRQLVLTVVVILIAVTLAIGSVSVVVQRQLLINRVDEQLRMTLEQTERSVRPGQGPGDPDGPGSAPGPQLGTLSVIEQDGQVLLARLIDESGTEHTLDGEQLTELIETAGTAPSQIDLVEYGAFRVLRSDRGGARVIAGVSLRQVSGITQDLVVTFALVGLGAVGVSALAARTLIRRALRPLEELATTAAGVSATPLASGSVSLTERVPQPYTAPGTEVGQVGAALNRMLDHVERSLQAREDSEERLRRFIADASHELRTPLAAVHGYAELANRQAGELPADVAHSLQRIGSESARMAAMVQDLLLLARLDSGGELDRRPVEIARIVVDACADAQVTGPDHRWRLDLAEDAADILVLGDAARLHQVMLNLLSNARMHTPPGTTVTVSLTSEERSRAVITVADDGPGIPGHVRSKVFDRFVRTDDSRSRASGSTGLGMSIVSAIVAAHGGEIGLDSRPGRTVFTVRLPIASEADSSAPVPRT